MRFNTFFFVFCLTQTFLTFVVRVGIQVDLFFNTIPGSENKLEINQAAELYILKHVLFGTL